MHYVKLDPKFKALFWILACILLLLGTGCAPKVMIQPFPDETASAPQPETAPDRPNISETILAQYHAWKGVPHRTGGHSRRGVDCSGLMIAVFRDAFSLDLPRTSREQSRLGLAIKPQERRPGDLVFFKDRGRDHIGVVVDQRRFLHTSYSSGVTLSEFDSYWNPRLKHVRRILPG